MRGTDLREADFLRDLPGGLFMLRVAVAMHKHNRSASQPTLILINQLLF